MDFSNITMGKLVDEIAGKYPDNDALVYHDRGLRLSYEQFRLKCNQFAKGLMKLGIQKGEKVAVWANNVPEWVIAQFSCGKMGAILVTVNTNYRSFELEYLLNQSDTNTLIMIPGVRGNEFIDIVYELCPELKDSEPGQLKSEKFPHLKNVIFIGSEKMPGMYNWEDIEAMGDTVSDDELTSRQDSLKPDEVINMQYTSGTTGYPKGVMLSHTNIIGNARSQADCLNFTEKDRLCIPVPFFHCFGCVMSTLLCVVSGAAMVPLVAYKPKFVLETIEKEKCTAVHGVPTMFIGELEEMANKDYDTSHLRTGIMAGSPCPIEVMKEVVEKMGANEICITYGQTESAPGITMTRSSDPIELRVSTVGRALPNVEVKIVDPATGEAVPTGVQGELCTRGYHVMKGYYKQPEATAAAIDEEGWLHTGDLGTMDENGYCKITGRLKDMIIRGGENIYPREIEEFLYTHPKIKDVQVVGVPSAKYGEEVVAFVQLKEGQTADEEEIKQYCVNKISRFKIPAFVLFVNDYPATASGKVQKYKLREQAIKILGREEDANIETA